MEHQPSSSPLSLTAHQQSQQGAAPPMQQRHVVLASTSASTAATVAAAAPAAGQPQVASRPVSSTGTAATPVGTAPRAAQHPAAAAAGQQRPPQQAARPAGAPASKPAPKPAPKKKGGLPEGPAGVAIIAAGGVAVAGLVVGLVVRLLGGKSKAGGARSKGASGDAGAVKGKSSYEHNRRAHRYTSAGQASWVCILATKCAGVGRHATSPLVPMHPAGDAATPPHPNCSAAQCVTTRPPPSPPPHTHMHTCCCRPLLQPQAQLQGSSLRGWQRMRGAALHPWGQLMPVQCSRLRHGELRGWVPLCVRWVLGISLVPRSLPGDTICLVDAVGHIMMSLGHSTCLPV